MIVRRLYSAYSLLAFLDQETALTAEWGGQVPIKGLKRTQLIVLDAVLLYQLVLLFQFEHDQPLGKGIKPLLRAA